MAATKATSKPTSKPTTKTTGTPALPTESWPTSHHQPRMSWEAFLAFLDLLRYGTVMMDHSSIDPETIDWWPGTDEHGVCARVSCWSFSSTYLTFTVELTRDAYDRAVVAYHKAQAQSQAQSQAKGQPTH